MQTIGAFGRAAWLSIAGAAAAAGTAAAVMLSQGPPAANPADVGAADTASTTPGSQNPCREALATTLRPAAAPPPGYAAGKRIVAVGGRIDWTLSEPPGDATALAGALSLGRFVQPLPECEGEVVWVYPKPPVPNPPPTSGSFTVIRAPGGQPAIWPVGAPPPGEWVDTGQTCGGSACLVMLGDPGEPDGSSTSVAYTPWTDPAALNPNAPPPVPPTPPAVAFTELCPPPDTAPAPNTGTDDSRRRPATTGGGSVSAPATAARGGGGESVIAWPRVANPGPVSVTATAPPPAEAVGVHISPGVDQFFVRDGERFTILLRYDGPATAGSGSQASSACAGDDVARLTVTPVGRLDVFLGLRETTVTLRRGESKEIQVTTQEMFPRLQGAQYHPVVTTYSTDYLFGAHVVVSGVVGGQRIRDHEFSAYRYRDVADDLHGDGTVAMEPTLADGPGKVARRRPLFIDVPPPADIDFVEVSPEFGVSRNGNLVEWIFDPQPRNFSQPSQRELIRTHVPVRNRKFDRIAGVLTLSGEAAAPQVVDLNLPELLELLQHLAEATTPDGAVHWGLITAAERAEFNTDFRRRQLTVAIEARARLLFREVEDGLRWGAVSPNNGVQILYKPRANGTMTNDAALWAERWPAVKAFAGWSTGTAGVTASDGDYMGVVTQSFRDSDALNHSAPERNYRVAQLSNRVLRSTSTLFVDNILEMIGPAGLTLTRPQIVNALSKTLVHEAAHAMGQTHTSQYRCCIGIPARQRVALEGGLPTGRFRLGFNGALTEEIEVFESAAEVQRKLRDLSTINGPHVSVSRPAEEPRVYDVRFTRALAPGPMPLLTGVTLTGDGLTVRITEPEPGCASHVGESGATGPQMLLRRGPATGAASAGSDKRGAPCASSRKPAETAGHGEYDLMLGGYRDTEGTLTFQPELTLAGLKIALHVNYTTESFDILRELRLKHGAIVDAGAGWWGDSSQAPPPEATTEFVEQPPLRAPALVIEWDGGQGVPADLGVIALGGASAQVTREALVRNRSTRPLTLGAVQVLPAGTPFSAEVPSASLAPGQTAQIRLHYRPTSPGRHQARVLIPFDDASPLAVLEVIGRAESAAGFLDVGAEGRNVGGEIVGRSRGVRNVAVLRNTGSAPLVITGASVAHRGSPAFALMGPLAAVAAGQPARVAPGQSVTLDLTFAPKAPGLLPAEVVLTTGDGAKARVSVVGTGIDGAPYWVPGDDVLALIDPRRPSAAVRAQTDASGRFSISAAPVPGLRMVFFDPSTGLVSHDLVGRQLPRPVMRASTAADTDGDFLPDDIEEALGTSPRAADSNGDGRSDFDDFVARFPAGTATASAGGPASAAGRAGGTPTNTLGAFGTQLRAWMVAFAEELRTSLHGNLDAGQVDEVDGAMRGVYRSGALTDFVLYAESAVVTSGGSVTGRNRSAASPSVNGRFTVGGRVCRAEIVHANGEVRISIRPE